MIQQFHRPFLRWWRAIDQYLLLSLGLLLLVGGVMIVAAGPPAAGRIHLEPYHFVKRQLIFLMMAGAIICLLSWLNRRQWSRLALAGFGSCAVALALVPFIGIEIKGAHRWLAVGGIALQPSEFMKPFFALTIAWIFTRRGRSPGLAEYRDATLVYVCLAGLLLSQPDIGMTLTVTAIWCGQLFLAGLPLSGVVLLAILGIGGAAGAYLTFPHVRHRVELFLNPETAPNYQLDRSLAAFQQGGLLGRGAAEGGIKYQIPDVHTDFVFAVAGEEFGALVALAVMGLFCFIILRGMLRAGQQEDMFCFLAVVGILIQFAMQVIINIGVTLGLFPTKGMTLPFLSYGGSSTLALAIAMGAVLALTRRQYRRLKSYDY